MAGSPHLALTSAMWRFVATLGGDLGSGIEDALPRQRAVGALAPCRLHFLRRLRPFIL